MKKFEVKNPRMGIKDIEKELNNASNEKCNICLIIIPNNLKTQYKNMKISAMIG